VRIKLEWVVFEYFDLAGTAAGLKLVVVV